MENCRFYFKEKPEGWFRGNNQTITADSQIQAGNIFWNLKQFI